MESVGKKCLAWTQKGGDAARRLPEGWYSVTNGAGPGVCWDGRGRTLAAGERAAPPPPEAWELRALPGLTGMLPGALDPSISSLLSLWTETASGRLEEKIVCSRDAFTFVVRLGERINELQTL